MHHCPRPARCFIIIIVVVRARQSLKPLDADEEIYTTP